MCLVVSFEKIVVDSKKVAMRYRLCKAENHLVGQSWLLRYVSYLTQLLCKMD